MSLLKSVLPLVAALALPAMAQAASLRDCDTWEANARNIMFPVTQNVRSYANDTVHLIGLDTGSPACCSFHLMVLMPSEDGSYYECTLISREEQMGFANLSIADTAAGYDPSIGLRLLVPTYIYLPEQSFSNSGIVELTINQAVGSVTADFIPGPNE